jgi:hypothetical protein
MYNVILYEAAVMGEPPQKTADDAKPVVEGAFRLLLSDDQFMVFFDEITAPQNGGNPVTVEAVLAELKKQKLTQGIDAARIGEIIDSFHAGTLKFDPPSNNKFRKVTPKENFCIAKGEHSVPGEDGILLWSLDEIRIKDNNCAVLPGELIAIYHPASSGKEGVNVLGKKIPTKAGANNFPRIGIGIETSTTDKGEQYQAEWLGVIKYDDSSGAVAISVESGVSISEDEMEVHLDIYARSISGQLIQSEHIATMLLNNGVQHGLDENAIQEALTKAAQLSSDKKTGCVKQVLVAKGTPVQDGKDARLVLSRDNNNAGMELAGGRINFREKSYPWNVKKGDKAGYLMEAKTAADGRLVTGEVVTAKQPKEIEIELDGLHKDDNGRLIADKDGALIISTRSLYIVEILEISDVCQKTGNVRSDIPVHVTGFVEPGFKLESKKEIIIDNNIEDANVVSGGDILIKGGIRGMKSEVFAPGEVNVGFIENAKVFINGHLTVRGSIINSEIGSNGDILIGDENAKASIIGGIVTAHNKIETACLGSKIYSKTIVRVGFSQEMRREFNRLETELEAKKSEIEQLDQIEYRHTHYPMADSQTILAKVAATRVAKQGEIERINKAVEEMVKEANTDGGSKVIVKKSVFPGVTVSINEHTYDVTRELGPGVFSFDPEIKAVVFIPVGSATNP